jgi:hypothetical protein
VNSLSGTMINTTMRIYADGKTAVFSQFFPEALAYMSASNSDTAVMGINLFRLHRPHSMHAGVTDMVSSFPSFVPGTNTEPLSFLTYCNSTLTPVLGTWSASAFAGSTACGCVWMSVTVGNHPTRAECRSFSLTVTARLWLLPQLQAPTSGSRSSRRTSLVR